jgi:hypothetical protein
MVEIVMNDLIFHKSKDVGFLMKKKNAGGVKHFGGG